MHAVLLLPLPTLTAARNRSGAVPGSGWIARDRARGERCHPVRSVIGQVSAVGTRWEAPTGANLICYGTRCRPTAAGRSGAAAPDPVRPAIQGQRLGGRAAGAAATTATGRAIPGGAGGAGPPWATASMRILDRRLRRSGRSIYLPLRCSAAGVGLGLGISQRQRGRVRLAGVGIDDDSGEVAELEPGGWIGPDIDVVDGEAPLRFARFLGQGRVRVRALAHPLRVVALGVADSPGAVAELPIDG